MGHLRQHFVVKDGAPAGTRVNGFHLFDTPLDVHNEAEAGDLGFIKSTLAYIRFSGTAWDTLVTDGGGPGNPPDWSDIINKPPIFPPSPHADSHITGGSDVIASVVAGGAAGLMTGADKTKLNGIQTGAQVNVSQIIANANTANVVASAADTYLTGSALAIGGRIKIGTTMNWQFSMTKTAAGTAASVFNVRFGSGVIGDGARLVFTLPAQTAAVDTGYVTIDAIFRAIGATAVVHGVLTFQHINTTTGLINIAQVRILQVLSAAFDASAGGLVVGVSCNPGAAGVWTYQMVAGQAINLS